MSDGSCIKFRVAAAVGFGAGLLLATSAVWANQNVYVSRFWHNHQPIYWPEWNGNGSSQTERVQYAWDSIVLKAGQLYDSGVAHPENNLTDIFGLDDRRAAYQGRPRDSLSSINSEGGFAISYSGSLIDNVRNLADANQLGYGGGWWNGNRDASGWYTPSGSRRLDLVGFTYHHSLAPLMPKSVFRKELQIFKQAWWKAWDKNSDLSDHSKGYFPTEMAFSPTMVDVLVDEGYEWTIVASHHLSRTCPTYLTKANPTGAYGIYSSPPNKADQLGPSPTDGWWFGEPNPGNAAWNVAPYAYQLHRVKYVNPNTGAEKTMFMVPSDDVLSYRFGYANEGIGKIQTFISPFATDPTRPVLVMPSSDGDNAWGGGFSSWLEATPQFFNDSAGAGYRRSVPQDFVNAAGGNAPISHIEDGAWIFPEMDYGSPYFLKWIEPPVNVTNPAQCYPGTKIDLESPGFALKFWSWAPVIAGANWCETAEQIYKAENGANSVQAWKIQAPYDWNGSYSSPNVVERAWHIYLAGLDSGFNYYGGLGNDDEVKQSLATRRATEMLQGYMSTRLNSDQTPPTVLKPQRFPWNPGAHTFGWFNSFGSGTNTAFLKKMPSDFYIWTHAYDINGITSIEVKVRKDNDGVNTMANNQNETYAGGGEVGSWVAVPMTKRVLPNTSAALNAAAGNGQINYFSQALATNIADYYFAKITDASLPGFRGKLLDYYIEAHDSKGNVHKSEIQHVFVEDDGGGSGPIPSEVSFSSDPRDCADLAVTYKANGGVLSNSTPVTLQYRFDTNGSFTSATMANTGNTSTYTIVQANIPDNAPAAEMYFQNGATIDNNYGANYSTTIRDCNAPTGTSALAFSNAPACDPVTITYYPNAGPLQAAAQVYLHLGYNNWAQVFPLQPTVNVTANQWRISVTPPQGATNITMAFSDGADEWDNNGGLDWAYALNYCAPPVIPPGVVITNPPTDIGVSNEVTTFNLKGTAGTSVSGLLAWSNSLNGATGQLSVATHWDIAGIPLAVGTNVISVIGTNTGVAIVTNASDGGSGAAYGDGWQAGDNGGSGFGAWVFTNSSSDANQNGQFMATSAAVNIGTPAWGFYANSGKLADARRPLPGPLAAGQTLAVKMDNGFLDSGAGTGVALYNSDNEMLWEFFFNGGDQNYSISGGSTDIGWTPGGLDIELTLSGPTSYVARIAPLGGSTRTNTGHFEARVNMTATVFRAWNYNAGSGPDFDFFVNGLRVFTAGAGAGAGTGDTVAITREAGITDQDGDGIPDAWEIQHYGCATCAVSDADGDGDGATAWAEFVADTVPTNGASVWSNRITLIGGLGVMSLWVPAPTTNTRIYEAWYTTNLTDGPWVPMGFDLPGPPNGAGFALLVTNGAEMRVYRTGVKLP